MRWKAELLDGGGMLGNKSIMIIRPRYIMTAQFFFAAQCQSKNATTGMVQDKTT